MRLALVADWLTTFGGAEHVLSACTQMFPEAPVFTTLRAKGEGRLGPLEHANIRITSLQRWYNVIRHHQVLLPWMPQAIESIDLTGYDIVLSSSHAVGKGVIVAPQCVHICYCHTPVRYAWEMEQEYLDDFRVPRLLRPWIKRQLNQLRRWDMSSAKRVDRYIANSLATQERIKRIYGRDSIVIPPPVHERFFAANSDQRIANSADRSPLTAHRYFLAVGRLVPYKRFDLLIQLANKSGIRLKIAGTGQDEARLRALAGPSVEFLGFVPESELPALYAGAQALLFPQHEDAGIVALEAMASGTPVIAYRAGGALDAVREGETGILFAEQSLTSLEDALARFDVHSFDRELIRAHATQFSQETFRKKLLDEVLHSFHEKSRLSQG